MSLTVSVLRARREQVDLGELIPEEDAELLYEDERGDRTLAVSSTHTHLHDDLSVRQRVVTRYAQDGASWRAIDETTFTLDAEHFSEVSQRRAEAGPNLHRAPIRLPRVMRVGAWHHPIAGLASRVALAEHAWVRLELGSNTRLELPAVAFLSVEGARRGLQWSLLGIGEAWNGPPGGVATRWLVGGRLGARAILAPVPERVFTAPRLGLPPVATALPRSSLF